MWSRPIVLEHVKEMRYACLPNSISFSKGLQSLQRNKGKRCCLRANGGHRGHRGRLDPHNPHGVEGLQYSSQAQSLAFALGSLLRVTDPRLCLGFRWHEVQRYQMRTRDRSRNLTRLELSFCIASVVSNDHTIAGTWYVSKKTPPRSHFRRHFNEITELRVFWPVALTAEMFYFEITCSLTLSFFPHFPFFSTFTKSIP